MLSLFENESSKFSCHQKGKVLAAAENTVIMAKSHGGRSVVWIVALEQA